MPTLDLIFPSGSPDTPLLRACLDQPEKDNNRSVVLLAHGAGVGMSSPFMGDLAEGLAGAGFPVLRFHYAYAQRMLDEGRRRPPDRRPALEAAHLGALALLREHYPSRPVLLTGKSMGGRMSTYLVAEGAANARGIVLFGYPLHPPGKPEKLRDDHFPAVTLPSLFLQGTRDALCDLDLLNKSLARYGGPAQVHVIEGADHGFSVLKRSGRTPSEVQAELVTQFTQWEAGLDPV